MVTKSLIGAFQFIKKMSGLIFLLGVILALSGCAHLMYRLGYARLSVQPPPNPCANATVLVTNLTVSPEKRHYQLPNGKKCVESE